MSNQHRLAAIEKQRQIHLRKRDDVSELTRNEVVLRAIVARTQNVSLFEYEYEVEQSYNGQPHWVWFDASIWILVQPRHYIFALVDIIPIARSPRGDTARKVKQHYAAHTDEPILFVKMDDMAEAKIRAWVMKVRQDKANE